MAEKKLPARNPGAEQDWDKPAVAPEAESQRDAENRERLTG